MWTFSVFVISVANFIAEDTNYCLRYHALESTCDAPPTVENQQGIHVFRQISSGKFEAVSPPYKYNDMALYSCESGFMKESNVMFHFCDSRRVWTGTTSCRGAVLFELQ